MKPAVVITTIHPPSPSIARWIERTEWPLIIVADRKTPPDWAMDRCLCVSVDMQQALPFNIARQLPWNHYARKMIGYLIAMRQGADAVVDTDDDNEPLPGYGILPEEGDFGTSRPDLGFLNVYRHFSDQWTWPRGFPLHRLRQEAERPPLVPETRKMRIGVWQGLVRGEPDVDAIFRMTVHRECPFMEKPPLVLEKGTICPINSQNTIFFKKAFPLLYLPAFVSFRFTDILRGIIAQPIMWAAGLRTGFVAPTAAQNRNSHDLLQDFRSEIPCYLQAEAAADIATAAVNPKNTLSDNLHRVYKSLCQNEIVPHQELEMLEAWLADLSQVGGSTSC